MNATCSYQALVVTDGVQPSSSDAPPTPAGPPGAHRNPRKESGYGEARLAQLLVPERQLGKRSVGARLEQPR